MRVKINWRAEASHPCLLNYPNFRYISFFLSLLTLGAHAQRGYSSCLVCVCVSVCMSVRTRYSGSTRD